MPLGQRIRVRLSGRGLELPWLANGFGTKLKGVSLITVYGVVALSFMMSMYALERHGRRFVLAFAFGCVLSSVYGFISGAWPFGVVEAIWCWIAVQRYRSSSAGVV